MKKLFLFAALFAATFTVKAPALLWLTWANNNPPESGYVTEVWHTTDLNEEPFSKIVDAALGNSVSIFPDRSKNFFIVRAKDSATGAVSDWNQP